MSYEPTNWKTGDVVTSAKLNKLENGVANASGGGDEKEFLINVLYNENDQPIGVDKTLTQIAEAIEAEKILALYANHEFFDKIYKYSYLTDSSGNIITVSFFTFDIIDLNNYAQIKFYGYDITNDGLSALDPVTKKINYTT